jgi:hypothetical protein
MPEARMRKWLAMLLLVGVLCFPSPAKAQSPIKLSRLQVQLWPEYDQPTMLVIYDFQLPESIRLPVSVSLNFPKEGHLVAVASLSADGSLLNTDYIGPTANEAWQTITIQIQTATTYHLEYYQPLTRTGDKRDFTFQWPGDYAVDDISVNIRVPPDTSDIVTDPSMKPTKAADGSSSLVKDFGALQVGQRFPLHLTYTRTSNALTVSGETVQPTKPLDSSTPGRVLLSNYLPYVAGVLGIVLVGAGAIYFLQPRSPRAPARRQTHLSLTKGQTKAVLHCHQCGARAQPGDRFCRVCGTKLRVDS